MGNTITLLVKLSLNQKTRQQNINHNHHGKNGHDIIRW
jgi:hypothetical protein